MLRSSWTDRIVIVAFIVLFIVLVRSPGMERSVIDWDESNYILVAREILQGNLPYMSIVQEKPFASPLLMALAMKILGPSVTSIRILGLLMVTATSFILRATAIRLGLSRFAGLVAALFYGLETSGLGGLPTNTEILLAPYAAAAVWVAAAHRDATEFREQLKAIALAGSLFGLAIWFKYVPAFAACALFGVLAGSWIWRRRVSALAVLGLAAIYAVACWLPTLLAAAFYVWLGLWDEFWYANFGFMFAYATVHPPWSEISAALIAFLVQGSPVLLLGGISLVLWRDAPALTGALLIWLLAEVIAVSVPGKFFGHYYLMLFPPLCLLSALGVDGLRRRIARSKTRFGPATGLACFVGLLSIVAVQLLIGLNLFSMRQPDPARQIAQLIRDDPEPGATVWVVNFEPIVYFLAGIKLPTRFAFPPALLSDYSVLNRTDPGSEVQRILDTRPRYLLIDPNQWRWVTPAVGRQVLNVIEADYALLERVPAAGTPIEVYRLLK